LSQAPQDWQFRLDAPDGLPLSHETAQGHLYADSDAAIEEALQQVMPTPGGPRLVAAGLALKAWL
jgi:hypothetical protein